MNLFEIWHYSSIDLSSAGGIEKFISAHMNALSSYGIHSHVGTALPPMEEISKHSKALILHTHGDCWPDISMIGKIFYFKNRGLKTKWIHISHGNTVERMRACGEYLSYSGTRGALRDFSLIQMCDAIVAVSQHAKDENKKYFRITKRTDVIHNGADLQLFKPLNAVEQSNRLLFVGRSNDRVKNISLLLAVFESLRSQFTDLELGLAPGHSTSQDGIINLGLLTTAEISEKIKRSKAVVLPSLYEGDPLILREAMTMGVPIIASDISANRETCVNYKNVFYFNPHSKSDLKRALVENILGKTLQPTPQPRGWMEVAGEYKKLYESSLFTNS